MTFDIIIVGAGPAGLSFTRSLAGSGLKIAIIEQQAEKQIAEPQFDGRDIALTHHSVQVLKQIGVWARLEQNDRPPIREARVLNGTSPYCLSFDSRKDSTDVLGYIVSNHAIRKALYDEVLALNNIRIMTDLIVTSVTTDDRVATVVLSDGQSLKSKLIIAADSRFSDTRRMVGIPASMHEFGRICIVCRMDHDKPHDGIAFECFHYGRTLAVLPLSGKQSSVVITAPMDQRDSIMKMDKELFNHDVEQRFGSRLGSMTLISERFAYPLVGVHARKFYTNRFALIGDAAVGMHPVTAHGFNLGLSSAEILAKEITSATRQGKDFAAIGVLERYQRRHMRTTKPMYHGTNEIVKLFTDDRAPTKFVRRLALHVVNKLPPVKWAIQNKLTAG